jgi:hypothetical protein
MRLVALGIDRAVGAALMCVALLGLSACGDSGDGGGAGAPAEPAALGEPCEAGGCDTGLACARGGQFSGLCTVGCTNDQSCQLLAPGTRAGCYGTTNSQCALGCTGPTDCPEGTRCAPAGSRMACIPASGP